MRTRELSPIALAQLSAWREYASRWYFRLERRQTNADHRVPNAEQYHLICAVCDNSLAVMSSEGIGYLLNTERLLDEVTRHLRNIHRGIEAEVYGTESPASSAGAPGNSTGNGTSPDTS